MSTPGLQFTWADGDVLVWQPGRGAAGGNLQESVRRLAARPGSPASVGVALREGPSWRAHRLGITASERGVRIVTLFTPDGEQRVMCQRVDLATLAALEQQGHLDAVSQRFRDGATSPSAAWFGDAFRAARHVVGAGRMMPRVYVASQHQAALTWQALPGDLEQIANSLAASMPPVVRAAEPERDPHTLAADVVASIADELTRTVLANQAWRPTLTDTRRAGSRALRIVGKALATPGESLFVFEPGLADTVGELAHLLQRIAQRADGLPIFRVRLRLGLPADGRHDDAGLDAGPDDGRRDDAGPDDDAISGDPTGADPALWPLTLEVFDADDRSRWCTAGDVFGATPLAGELAGARADAASALRSAVDTARTNIPAATPWLAEWVAAVVASHGSTIGIEIEEAAALLQAVPLLDAVDIELLVPEALSRRKPSARGTVSSSPVGPARLGATALVDWQLVIDDTPIDDVTLSRAAELGAGLIQVGGRWVRVDRADAQRALAALAQHRSDHAEVGGLDLLRLVAESADTIAATAPGADGAALAGSDDVAVELVADGWAAALLDGLPEATLTDGVVPDSFAATLRPYQVRGLGWLQFLHRLGLGGCLADDMGLGKTPTTLAHLAGIAGPHLVVCPLSVVRNWQREAARFTPLARVAVHHGTGRADAVQFAALAASHDIVITTYQVAARDRAALGAVDWQCVVLDEAQAIKNSTTNTARAMRTVPAVQRIALTGTPVENRLSELWSIFHVVVPGLLGSLDSFKRRFAGPIERDQDPAATARLRQLTAPFLLRRTKADKSLVPDLPDKVEQIAWAPLTREQASMYQAVVDKLLLDAQQADGMRRRGLVLAALTRLKQICNHPAHALKDGSKLAGRSGKLARFDELVTDLLDADEQALVFTQFREMGELLQQHLRERFGLATPFLHGGVPKSGRDRMVDHFQAGTGGPLLLVSLKAGGTGLNLTAASRVVHYDRWWNPAVEDQATDRAWRIGQTNAVFVHKLVCQGTIEERVDALINDKRALANAVVGAGGEAWLSEMSTDELRDLVTLDLRSAVGDVGGRVERTLARDPRPSVPTAPVTPTAPVAPAAPAAPAAPLPANVIDLDQRRREREGRR